ncbi:MAG: hypothetical protein ACJ8EL_07875 [Rhizomicrobium sp.]
MYDPNTAPPPKLSARRWTAGAVAVLVIGLLILIPSGLCTGIFGVGALYGMIAGPSNQRFSLLLEVLTIGTLPLAIGGGLVFLAFKMRKKA